MKIYRLIADLDSYGQLEFDNEILLAALGNDRFMDIKNTEKPWAECWPEPPAEFCEYDGQALEYGMPDLSIWQNTGLVLSAKANDALGRMLAPFGELLPFLCDDEPYWLFRCTASVSADEANSHKIVEDGLDIEITDLAFLGSEVGTTPLFSSEYDHHRNLFCSEKFKSVVKDAKLTGVSFSEKLGTSIF